MERRNGWGDTGYSGPCPPSGTHHYHIKLYALDSKLDLKEGAERSLLDQAMMGHIVGMGALLGLYRKSK